MTLSSEKANQKRKGERETDVRNANTEDCNKGSTLLTNKTVIKQARHPQIPSLHWRGVFV
jgi:hypothetical protein